MGQDASQTDEVQLAGRPRLDNQDLLDNWEEFVQARREAEGLSDSDEIWSSFKEALEDGSDDEDEYDDVDSDDLEDEAAAPAPVEPITTRPGFTSPLEVCPAMQLPESI